MKKVMVQFNFPGMTAKQYEQAWDEMRRTGNDHPKGLIHHAGAQQGNNLVISDVWESKEAFNEFGKVLTPILNKIGAPQVQPTISDILYEQQEPQAQSGIQGTPRGQYGTQAQQPGNQAQQQGQYGSQGQQQGRSQGQQPGNQAQQPGQASNRAQQPGQAPNRGQQPGQRGTTRNEEEI